MKEKIKDLELRVQLLSSRKKQFHSVQLENNSLKNDNQILRHQLNNISQLSEDTNNIYLELQKQSPTIKNNSFENINQLHLLKLGIEFIKNKLNYRYHIPLKKV